MSKIIVFFCFCRYLSSPQQKKNVSSDRDPESWTPIILSRSVLFYSFDGYGSASRLLSHGKDLLIEELGKLAAGIGGEPLIVVRLLAVGKIAYALDDDGNLIPRTDACSVKRAETWFNTRDCAILTAWRGGKSRKTNDDNNRKLQRRLRELGYGVTKITGWFAEKDKEVARENSFLTVNLNEEDSFRSNIYELSELYEQDSFLYKKAGRDIPAVLVHTNDDTGKGTEELAVRLRIGNMEADIYSQIKAGRITFE